MTAETSREGDPTDLVRDHERALMAARRAVYRAWLEHKRRGDPIVVSHDGRAIWIPAEEIVIPETMPDEASA